MFSRATLLTKAQETEPSYGTVESSKQARPLASIVSKLAAEALGTFILVFTVACTVGLHPKNPWNYTAIACALVIVLYALGPISGGHFNPAVSLAFGVLQKLDWKTVALYWIAQIVGGLFSGLWAFALLGPLTPEPAVFSPLLTYTAEAIYTFMLIFVILSCTASTKNNPPDDPNQFFGLAIGFVVVAGGYASSAILNPAVAIGTASLWAASGTVQPTAAAAFSFILSNSIIIAIEMLAGGIAVLAFWVVHGPSERGERVSLLSKCVSEWLGTFLLALTVGLNLVTNSPATPWSAAAALMCMIYSLALISGANFNPAVTVAVMVRGKLTFHDAAAYVLTQLIAGCCAGLLFEAFHLSGGPEKEVSIFFPTTTLKLEGAMAEMLFTFVLAFVVVSVATVKPAVSKTSQNNFAALAIGSAVTAGGFAVGLLSGGELNPAVSLSILLGDIVHQVVKGWPDPPEYDRCGTYMFAELAGGVLAGSVFFITHLHEFHEGNRTSDDDRTSSAGSSANEP